MSEHTPECRTNIVLGYGCTCRAHPAPVPSVPVSDDGNTAGSATFLGDKSHTDDEQAWRDWLLGIAGDEGLSDLRVHDLVLSWAEEQLSESARWIGQWGWNYDRARNQTIQGRPGGPSVETQAHTAASESRAVSSSPEENTTEPAVFAADKPQPDDEGEVHEALGAHLHDLYSHPISRDQWDDIAESALSWLDDSTAPAQRDDGLREAVERLAAEWESWSRTRTSPRIDAFRDAAEALRAVLRENGGEG